MTGFDVATAVEDFAGPGRNVEVISERHELTGLPPSTRRQMRLSVNGWEFSVIWGRGAYCTAARADGMTHLDNPPPQSPDAEVMVWPKGGEALELGSDTVAGWVSPDAFIAAVEAAERGEVDGIRTALLRGEDA